MSLAPASSWCRPHVARRPTSRPRIEKPSVERKHSSKGATSPDTLSGSAAHVEGDVVSTPSTPAVLIVGAGPAGLLLSHLLAARDIPSIVVESRTREAVEQTIRAGILEQGTVDLLVSSGASSRVLVDGHRHDGIELRTGDAGHRIDFPALTGRSVWLYPQHEVLRDLIATRVAAGQDLRFETTVTDVDASDPQHPVVLLTGPDGAVVEVRPRVLVGADGSRSRVREAVTGAASNGYFREYPFAWFGILCEAPPSAPELIYSSSDDGFALISQRSDTVQRMYFQCDPDIDPASLGEEQIWDELQRRVPGTTLRTGPIFQRDVLRFRSFVASSLRRGRIALAGDAAHTVPPTGAKGLNLAVADVVLLDAAIAAALAGDESRLEAYEEAALRRIWKAQHFSWWMTSLLHRTPDATAFDRLRQRGELQSIVESEAGCRYLAEAYTGWRFATE
ncbi:MAG: 4-hydroxybenzoate 3-monooxygenase [Microbacterium sp.]|nr:4-hydroxybenzoate 3-monooxygenase [Microbacterium sp.]